MPEASANASQPGTTPRRVWTFVRILQLALTQGAWFGVLFAAAGTISWLRGWICMFATLCLNVSAVVLIGRRNPALIAARAQWRHRDTKPFDKVFVACFVPLYFAQAVAAGLEVVRLGWSVMAFTTVYLGLALLASGTALALWAMLVNPFAETTVRIQKDRGQSVVTNGPYHYVRHPIYGGAVLMYPALGLVVGSYWALAIGGVMALLFVYRTAREDRVLRSELPGYQAYADVTSYRLVPGVW